MEQKSVGIFIQELRKAKGITQRELAEKIGISDKTVSKWENGNSMPDTSMLLSLCQALEISVNELLSCQRLPLEEYSKKAEENMMSLLKDKELSRKRAVTSTITGIALGVIAILFLYISTAGTQGFSIGWFIDPVSFLFLLMICAACVFMSQAEGSKEIVRVIHKTLIPAGVFVSFFSCIVIIGKVDDPAMLGPNLAVAFLAPVYALLTYIILIPVRSRLEKKY